MTRAKLRSVALLGAVAVGALAFLLSSYASGTVSPGTLRWVIAFPSEKYTSVGHLALLPDESTLLFPSLCCLVVISPEGKVQRTLPPEFWNFIPVIGPNGWMYNYSVESDNVVVIRAFSPDGTLQWSRPLPLLEEGKGIGFVTFSISRQGILYVNFRRFNREEDLSWREVHGLNASNGDLLWSHVLPSASRSSQWLATTVLEDGTLLLTVLHRDRDEGDLLVRVSSNGELQTIKLSPSNPGVQVVPEFPPLIDQNGNIYLVFFDRQAYVHLYVLQDDALKEFFSIDETLRAGPVIGLDGTLYLVTAPQGIDVRNGRKPPLHTLWAISPTGKVKWTFSPSSFFIDYTAGLLIGADGTIYLPTTAVTIPDPHNDRGILYALSPNGEVRWEFPTIGGIAMSSVIAQDGTLYFTTVGPCSGLPMRCETRVYALYTDSPGLADSPWPMFRADPQHTGQVRTSQP